MNRLIITFEKDWTRDFFHEEFLQQMRIRDDVEKINEKVLCLCRRHDFRTQSFSAAFWEWEWCQRWASKIENEHEWAENEQLIRDSSWITSFTQLTHLKRQQNYLCEIENWHDFHYMMRRKLNFFFLRVSTFFDSRDDLWIIECLLIFRAIQV